MTISRPDYSLLQNSIATKNAINERDATREANKQISDINGAMSLLKTAASVTANYITTQDEAQQARLKPELEAKSTYYNQLLNESIKNGTTTITQDEAGRTIVNYAPEVMEYRNSWLDDINSRDGISRRTKEWASQQMDSVYNMSDEQVLYTIAANNAAIASTDMDKTVQDAALISANQGSTDYLESVIAGLNISDQYKQAYRQDAMAIYDGEYQSLHSRDLATTEGIQAAYKYIDGLTADSATKDTLKNNALAAYQKRQQAVQLDTQSRVSEMLEAGSSWTEIQKTLIPQGQNANEKDLIKTTIKSMQAEQVTGLCAPYLAQVQSGTATTDELQNIKTLLKSSKYMFSGGLEGTYETYMGLVDKAIADSKSRKSEDYTEANLLGQNLYNQWNQGKISSDDAISQLRAYGEAHADALDVVNTMDGFVNKIIDEKVPLMYRGYFNMKMNDFSKVFPEKVDAMGYTISSGQMATLYEKLYKDTVNFISANPEMTLDQIDNFMNREMDSFFAGYADARTPSDTPTTSQPVQLNVNPTKVKDSAATVVNDWNAGLYSTDQAIDYLTQLADMTTDTSVAKDISDKILTIQKQKVPEASKRYYDDEVKNFDKLYSRFMNVNKIDDLDNDQYVDYLGNKDYFEIALADYISKNPRITQDDITKEAVRIVKTFSQPYATQDTTLDWKLDTVGSQTGSFIETLKSFEETVPFTYTYNQVTGKIQYEWVNDKAQANWDNTGRYGLQALRNAGYDVSSYEVFEYGGNAYPIMVFRSSDGKAKYTIDTASGNIMEIRTQTIGNQNVLSMVEVTPEQTQQAGAERGARTPVSAPRNYTFDTSTMEGGNTNPSSNGGTNFKAQQEAMDKAKKDEQTRARDEKRRQMDEQFANRNSGELTTTQRGYVSELEAEGYGYNEAYQLAPVVDKYMVEQKLSWDEAIKKALSDLGIKQR